MCDLTNCDGHGQVYICNSYSLVITMNITSLYQLFIRLEVLGFEFPQ